MHRSCVCVLRDLFRATKPVRDDEGVGGGRADGGQQDAVAEGLRDFVLIGFKAEGPGHAAAARVEKRDLRAGATQQCDFVSHSEGGSVMAVTVEDDLLGDLWRLVIRSKFQEEFA